MKRTEQGIVGRVMRGIAEELREKQAEWDFLLHGGEENGRKEKEG